MEHIIEIVVPEITHILELMGIVIISIGAVRSFVIYIMAQIRRLERRKTPVNIKIMLGKSLELGLEYKMGAEILKTVLIRDMSEIWILGAIIILRAMLSILLSYELRHETEGRPVRGKKSGAADSGRATAAERSGEDSAREENGPDAERRNVSDEN